MLAYLVTWVLRPLSNCVFSAARRRVTTNTVTTRGELGMCFRLVAALAAGFDEHVALHVEELRLAAKVDVLLLQVGHQLLGEGLLLLARLPNLADVEAVAGGEAHVGEQARGRPDAGLVQ